jgi:hypothetical protein
MKKDIVILAKSVKRGQYCIAGREIIRRNSELHIGDWVRPISNHDEGAVSSSEARLLDGNLPEYLDIVEIDVVENVKDPTQPENWMISTETWKKKGAVTKKNQFYNVFTEEPAVLWESSFGKNDRITTDDFLLYNHDFSICMIKPEKFVMRIYTEYNQYQGYNQKKRRGKIWYNGIEYDLAITDPEIDEKYFHPFPDINDGVIEFELAPETCVLCVSLTPEFNGSHYKVITTVIEND